MSHFFTRNSVLNLTKLGLQLFITLCIFINFILRFGYNTHHNLCKYKRKANHKPTTITKYRVKAQHKATVSRHVDNMDLHFEIEQKTCTQSTCMKTVWLNRQIRQKAPWLMDHILLNDLKKNEFVAREKELWNQFANNKQRLLNILYTSINSHIPQNAIRKYRSAVS